MSEIERLVLNPVEFTPELPEIDLEDLGLSIAATPGPDYGESSMTVERVRQAIGEGVTDAHWPSVECTIPIIASGSKELPIADPLHRLEAWVAEIQQKRSGWIRRDFSTDGGFAGSVGCPVDMAGLTPAQGWDFAHGQVAHDIVLKLSRHPIWYATVETLAGEAKGSGVRSLKLEIAELLGTAPGLIRLVVKNEGTEDWCGCMVAIECDTFSPAATALQEYEAQKLTPKGGAEVKEASGAKVVKCPPLTSGWQTVLGSEIAGVGYMTHVGPRRMAVRVEDPSEKTDAQRLAEWEAAGGYGSGVEKPAPQQVQWKLEWRQLGQANWIQTMESSTPIVVSSPVVGGYQVIDLGECRPELAVAGGQRWEWRLRACVPAAGPQGTLQPLIRDVYPATTEQWMRVADTSESGIDGEPSTSPAKAEDAAGVGTVAWLNPENAKSADATFATAENGSTKESQTSHYLKAMNPGFAIPVGATIRGITLAILRKGTTGTEVDNQVRLVKGGVVEAAADRAVKTATWPVSESMWRIYGGPSDLWGNAWTVANINATTFGVALSASMGVVGPLKGKAEVDAIVITVAYTEGSEENRICFASRSVEFSDSGIRRQHVTDEVWGELVAEGFLPYAPPSGQSGQPVRVLIVPTVGDFNTRGDAATVKPAAKLYCRPGYLLAREAV
jgi:hypothetical protein